MMKKSILKETGRLHNLICRRMRYGGKQGAHGTKLRGFVLEYLYQNEKRDVFQRDIERALHVRSSTATVVLNQMETEKIIERQSADSDKRLKKIILTEEAKRMSEKWRGFVVELEKKLLKDVNEEDLGAFYRVLDTVCLNLEDNK